MSRSNKNNRKKIRLSRNGTNEQPLRCSSSSGSSNYSDDMDVIRNAVLESLLKNAGAASGAATTLTPALKSKNHVTSSHDEQQQPQQIRQRQDGKSDDESRNDPHHHHLQSNNASSLTSTTTTVDSSRQNRKLDNLPVARTATIEELAMAIGTGPTLEAAPNPDDEQIRTDVKIVRIKTLDSEESKLLLIVDVLDRNPFRIEVNSEAAAMAERRRDEETAKCIKVDIEALKRGECPKEIRNLCTKVRSRRIYKLPDELMRKFDQKGLKVFEWHSFNRPDEVIKLLLDDGGGGAARSADSVVQNTVASPPAAAAAAADLLHKRMIIGFRRRSTSTTTRTRTADAAAISDEPAVKIRRTAVIPVSSVVGSEAKLMRSGVRKCRLATDQRSRNRILQRLLKEYSMSSVGCTRNTANVWDIVNHSRINRLVRSRLDLRAKEGTERANNRRKENNSDVTAKATPMTVAAKLSEARWKSMTSKHSVAVAADFGGTSTMKRDHNLDATKISLNDDNDGSVSNGNADVSAIDGNSDALNNSNNDDNDSKAKKKNRCALCRKKVGLTGFECRCGGLYCGIHRYSDKHNCTFDYRQLGAQEIRRNNPVVIGEKIQKI